MPAPLAHVLALNGDSNASCACGTWCVQASGPTPRARRAALVRAHEFHRWQGLRGVVVSEPAPSFALGATA